MASRHSRCVGWFPSHVTEVDVILVELQLIRIQDPALLAPVAQSFRPSRRPYYLVGSLLRRDAREGPAHVEHVAIQAVAFYGLPVNPSDIGGPAEVVGVRQPAGLAVALGDAGSVRHPRQEVVTLLEGIDTDAVLPGHGPQSDHQALVYYPGLEVSGRLGRRPEVGVLQKFSRLAAGRPGVMPSEPTRIPEATTDARRARRGDPHSLVAPEADGQ